MGSKRHGNRKRKRAAARGHWRDGVVAQPAATFDWYVRDALANGGPLRLLSMVSFMLSFDDARPRDILDRAKRAEWAPAARAEFVDKLLADPTSEASAVLAVCAAFMGDDDDLATTIRAELAVRPPVQPRSLGRLDETRVHRAVRISDALDETDILLLEGRLADEVFTCAVMVTLDRLQTVCEAELLPEPIDPILTRMSVPSCDFRCENVELADVGARLTKAIGWESFVPPGESETWPHTRALVEWLVRGLPTGGSAEPRPEWAGEDLRLVRQFLTSPRGRAFNRLHHDLVGSMVEFGSDCGAGDPMRWSKARARRWLFEGVLEDRDPWMLDYLEEAPSVLRAFVEFVHGEVGIRPDLTADVVLAIESWEPEFQDALSCKLAEDDDDDWLPAAGDG